MGERDELGESINDLFTSVSAMIKAELQGTNNLLELVDKMNLKVAEEYNGLGDVASGLRVFVEQLKSKSDNFDEYVQQIDAIERSWYLVPVRTYQEYGDNGIIHVGTWIKHIYILWDVEIYLLK